MFKSIALPCQIIALAFLILSLVTPPLTSSIALALHNNYKYGVFGYCKNTDCSTVSGASYTVSIVDSETTNWSMSDSSRDTFSKVLILSPVSCFLVLVSFFLTTLSHFVYNKGLLFVTMTLSILAFLSTAVFTIFIFLTFYPNITWTSWIQIGSSVLTLLAILLVVLEIVNFEKDNTSDDEEEDDDSSYHKNVEIRKVSSPFGHESSLPDLPKSTYVATKQFSAPSSSLDPSSRSNTLNNTSSYNLYANDYQPRTAPGPSTNTTNYRPPVSTITSSGAFRTTSLTSQNTVNNYNETTNSIEQINVIPPATQSDQILKLPNISNPYSENISDSSKLDEYDQTSNENDIRLSNLSPTVVQNQKQQPQFPTIGESPNRQSTVSSDSEFTSVSQREINPNYYRGYQQKNGPQHSYFTNSQPYYTNNSQPQQNFQQQQQQQQQQGQYYDSYENPQTSNRYSEQSVYANPYSDPRPQSQYQYESQPNQQQRKNDGDYLGNSSNQILEANPDMSTAGRIGSRPGVRKYGLHRLASKNISTTGGLNGQVQMQTRTSAQNAYGNTAAQLAGSGSGVGGGGYTNEFKKRQQLQSKGFIPGHGGTAGLNGMGGPYGGI